ncbi:unnamed protein product, partial [marine sediment metagenome]
FPTSYQIERECMGFKRTYAEIVANVTSGQATQVVVLSLPESPTEFLVLESVTADSAGLMDFIAVTETTPTSFNSFLCVTVVENLFEERTTEYLYDFPTLGALAAGNKWMPSPKDARIVDDATLDEDEVAELFAAEIVNKDDVPIEGFWLKLDDALEVDDEIFCPGRSEINMLPPWQRARHKQLIRFGKPASTNLL